MVADLLPIEVKLEQAQSAHIRCCSKAFLGDLELTTQHACGQSPALRLRDADIAPRRHSVAAELFRSHPAFSLGPGYLPVRNPPLFIRRDYEGWALSEFHAQDTNKPRWIVGSAFVCGGYGQDISASVKILGHIKSDSAIEIIAGSGLSAVDKQNESIIRRDYAECLLDLPALREYYRTPKIPGANRGAFRRITLRKPNPLGIL